MTSETAALTLLHRNAFAQQCRKNAKSQRGELQGLPAPLLSRGSLGARNLQAGKLRSAQSLAAVLCGFLLFLPRVASGSLDDSLPIIVVDEACQLQTGLQDQPWEKECISPMGKG